MLGGKPKWKEYGHKAINKNKEKRQVNGEIPLAANDDENPWLSISDSQPEQIRVNPKLENQPAAPSAPSRWLEDNTTDSWPDLSVKSNESKNRYDMKQTVQPSVRKNNDKTGDIKSVFLLQCILAGFLVLGGLYIHQTNRPFGQTVNKFTMQILDTDYTNRVVPVVSQIFNKFHVSVPTFGVHAAVYMHVPLQGKIDADFSANHPEIWILGNQDEPVLAAGSGIVTKVGNNGSNSVVEIDHGAIGTSVYHGLGTVTVRVHEYVDSGQVIGRMPQGTKNQELHFSLTKNGKYENPHDFIHFSAADSQ